MSVTGSASFRHFRTRELIWTTVALNSRALPVSTALASRGPTEPVYTFWSYLRNRWPRDAGLRIDHVLLSGEVKKRFVDAGVDKAVRGREGASDHAPVWIELR